MANGIVLNIDTTKSEFQNPMVQLRQGDGNYQSLDVTVTSNGEPLDLTGWTITFMGTTAGGFKIVDTAVSNVDNLNGKFTYTPTKAWGQNQGEFKNAYFSFVKSDKTASSAAFRVNVLDAVDITAEEAGDYISIVDQTIDKLSSDVSGLVTIVNDLKEQNNNIKTSNNTWTGTNTFNTPIVGSVTGSAAKLQTPRMINGTPFDGTSDITITGSGALAVGDVYPTLADLIAANPDHNRTYITTNNGNWNYWNGTTWVAGGVYQSSGIDYNVDGIRRFTPGKTMGAIDPFDGSVSASSTLPYYTVSVANVNRLTFFSESFTSNVGYAFYDVNGAFIPGSGMLERFVGQQTIDVPAMAVTFKVTSRPETVQTVTLFNSNATVEKNTSSINSLNTTIFGNKRALNVKDYPHLPFVIGSTSGKYTTAGFSTSAVIPIYEIGKAVRIKANSAIATTYTFLKTQTGNVGDTPDYATGYTGIVSLPAGTSINIQTPADAGFLFVGNTFDNGQIVNAFPEIINPMKDTIVRVAAANSSDLDKARADYVGTGINDEAMINAAIEDLVFGGTLQLLDGDYYLDSFSSHNNSAIFFRNNGYARTINFVGTTENKSNLSDYGVTMHVTQKAFDSMVSGTNYNVIIGDERVITIGQWWGFATNVNFNNFYLKFYTSQKPLVGINGQYFGSSFMKQFGVYSESYFMDRFDRHKPVTPSINSIGVISVNDANDEMALIGLDTVNVGGLGTGIIIARAEHVVMKNCTVARCVFGYKFYGDAQKPLTLINNADEGNRHLPRFRGSGLITAIDYSIERFDDTVIPDDPTGDTNPYAVEELPNGWKGTFDYNIQGSAIGLHNLWSPESGKNILTRKIAAPKSGTTNPSNPDYLQEFYRTDLNKKVIYNGDNWRDANGNIV